ncbi:hypothetical protein BGZ98_010387 [Dissophora globulifera]|nr:hypothetical protein BGZ98_010387 [Dissophora globulifera]
MQNSGGFMSAASAFGNTGASMAFGGGVQPNTGGSAFGSNGGAFNNTGSAFSGNSSASAFGSNTSNPSAFGGGFGSGGGRGGAFNNSMSNSNPHQHGGITASDGSGNTGFARGGGRGRGNISYRGGRGGAGGSWGSANKTYIAPALQQQQPNHPQISSGFAASGTGGAAELNGASGFAFPAGPSNRGRGGQTAGRGRGGRGGIAPGQHRSLQWRADGSHNQQPTDTSSMTMDDSNMGMTTPPQERFNSSAFGQSGQLQHQQQPQQAGPSTPSFSAFGAQGQGQGSNQFGGLSSSNPAGSVFGSSQPISNQWQSSAPGSSAPTSAIGAFSSAFGGQSSSLTSSSSSQNIHSVPKGVSNTLAPSSQNSIFASPTPRAAPGNNIGSSSGASPAFSAQRRSTPVIPESSTFSSSRQNANNQLEDSESRLARFTAVPIGNRFEEVRLVD